MASPTNPISQTEGVLQITQQQRFKMTSWIADPAQQLTRESATKSKEWEQQNKTVCHEEDLKTKELEEADAKDHTAKPK